MTVHLIVHRTNICTVSVDALTRISRAPMRTVRARDLADVYAYPAPALADLARRDLVRRLAHGVYCAVPPEHVGTGWFPTVEAAAAAVATAFYGDRVPVLTGVSAARVHQAWPRAVSDGYVAVPARHRPLSLADRPGAIRFVTRAVETLDAVAVPTELGAALVTTPEQTVLDLARSDPHGDVADVEAAIDAMWDTCDVQVLAGIAARHRMRATFERVAADR
ncbi:type IV toxin-antitoxin system AbiEi family antitoxin domain-containing protein [Cellulomonas flavigena]|nr:type IV toxin-antitoxin system AbiEi family antitoxin [Cellulomonas flavigena]